MMITASSRGVLKYSITVRHAMRPFVKIFWPLVIMMMMIIIIIIITIIIDVLVYHTTVTGITRKHLSSSAMWVKQEAQLSQRDRATRYVSKFVLCFTRYERLVWDCGSRNLKWVMWLWLRPFWGCFVIRKLGFDTLYLIGLQNLTILALAVREISLGAPKFKVGHVTLTTHSAAMCSRAWRAQWPGFDSARARPPTKELFLMIPMHMMNRELIPGR